MVGHSKALIWETMFPPTICPLVSKLKSSPYATDSTRAAVEVAAAKQVAAANGRGHIIWVVSPEVLEASLQTRKGEQRVSHVPGMHGLCRKGAFSLLAKHHAWDFAPETWILRPGETVTGDGHRRLRAALKAGALILKPDDGTQGDGIFIVRTLSELLGHSDAGVRDDALHCLSAVPVNVPRASAMLPPTFNSGNDDEEKGAAGSGGGGKDAMNEDEEDDDETAKSSSGNGKGTTKSVRNPALRCRVLSRNHGTISKRYARRLDPRT